MQGVDLWTPLFALIGAASAGVLAKVVQAIAERGRERREGMESLNAALHRALSEERRRVVVRETATDYWRELYYSCRDLCKCGAWRHVLPDPPREEEH